MGPEAVAVVGERGDFAGQNFANGIYCLFWQ
jgi:hypothetical protein